ncbi:MAG: DUF1552 domain-containing protein [Bdellovibrionota bacterium]
MTRSSRWMINRRQILKNSGLGLGLMPFLPLLGSDIAHGQAADSAPRRIVFFYTPQSTFKRLWEPSGGARNFVLPRILEPLEGLRNKIVVLNGVSMTNSNVHGGHTEGACQLWTGSDRASGSEMNLTPSLDYVISQRLKSKTALEYLQLFAGEGRSYGLHWSAANRQIVPEYDAANVLNRVFGSVNEGNAPPAPDTVRLNLLANASKELTLLKAKIAKADQLKIEAHLESIADIERSLQKKAGLVCSKPDIGNPNASRQAGWQAMMRLVAGAFSCDMTRVATITFGQYDNDGSTYPDIGVQSFGHHELTHMTPSDTLLPKRDNEADRAAPNFDESRNGQITKINRWYAEQFAYFIKLLNDIPEGEGTMLDNTLVVWGTEIGEYYSHSFENVPIIVAGGGNGGIQTGQYLDVRGKGYKINRLLVSMANYMGLSDVQKFGQFDTSQGGLPGLT